MAERIQRQRGTARADEAQVEVTPATTKPAVDYDALLDEIDSVLESDAEEYVRSFVQKGGQ
ncbi:ubiquitin-like protein Pup [Micropruina sp.]|jgi:ubiquitin-like protein Pup|uniref:ubiquitin-like protein Pup n=1 Tax=Micropruina sp. TaxID=2737536 RepID=UPI0034509596